jgi:hypothetical protein
MTPTTKKTTTHVVASPGTPHLTRPSPICVDTLIQTVHPQTTPAKPTRATLSPPPPHPTSAHSQATLQNCSISPDPTQARTTTELTSWISSTSCAPARRVARFEARVATPNWQRPRFRKVDPTHSETEAAGEVTSLEVGTTPVRMDRC